MTEENKPAWVELSTTDPAAARKFYADLFGWTVEVNPDPQYGGYALAKTGGDVVGGIGPKQKGDPSPSNWGLYIGTKDASATAEKVTAAGGSVVMPPFAVGDQGRMTVLRDPSGAFISAWQGQAMGGFTYGGDRQFGWAELSARGLERDIAFYTSVFGWDAKRSDAAADGMEYTEFQVGGLSIAGAMEMDPHVPANVPSYWMPYFNVADVDAAFTKATSLGARGMVSPHDFPGGRFAIVDDPQGAAFGLLKLRT